MRVTDVFAAATAKHRQGNLAEAARLYAKVLRQEPKHTDALFLLGVVEMTEGRLPAALDAFRRALVIAPDNAVCHANLGEVYRRLGRVEDAIESLLQAIAHKPNLVEPIYNLGLLLVGKGELEAALDCFQRAASMRPDNYAVQYQLACALGKTGDRRGAIEHLDLAIGLNPRAVEAYIDRANVLHILGRTEEAVADYQRALELDPRSAIAHNNWGTVLMDGWKVDDAAARFRRAIEIAPQYAFAHNNLGNAFKDHGRLEEAIAAYRQAVQLDPADDTSHGNLVYALSFHPAYDAPAILAEARAFGQRHTDHLSGNVPPHANERSPGRRLRIGYVSPDFRDHCQGLFMVPVMEHHDHDAFEIVCYSGVAVPDAITARIQHRADRWRNVAGLQAGRVASLIRQDGIDVLVDLTMHMCHSNLQVFAHKPAPVQLSWLAYPGTTGVKAIDYRLSDPYLDPPDVDAVELYSEHTYRLPDTFWCYDPGESPPVNALPALRNGYITFGCLNNFCKINAATVELWAEVMRKVVGSRLVFLVPEGEPRKRMAEIFERMGIALERCEFVDRVSRPEYLARYERIDVSLDTFPYNGHTTALDAFWMGVPVVTLVGRTVVGRAGLCQASHLGLRELIATSREEFVNRTVELTRDVNRLASIRGGLRERMATSPLMNASKFTKDLEHAFRAMWRAWCDGTTPASDAVATAGEKDRLALGHGAVR